MTQAIQRVAVVTGASRGLGRAIALALGREGLHVVVAARDGHAAAAVVREGAQAGLSMSAHPVDVTDPASVVRLMADTGSEFARLDVLVNNAAVAVDRGRPAHLADMETVQATLNANLMGPWRCVNAAVPEMRKHRYGRIVFVTSHMGTFEQLSDLETATGSPSYRVSKAASTALMCVLAAELAQENILVNAASPGKVATAMAYGKATQSPQDAAPPFVKLATLPDGGPAGRLFHEGQPLPW